MGIKQMSGNDVFAYNCEYAIVLCARDMEKNIADILKVIDGLISINGIDVSAIRLQLDTLLRIWEGRFYLDSLQ
jgi:hypothetical protein